MKVLVLLMCSSYAVIASGHMPEVEYRIASGKNESELLVKKGEYPYVVKVTRKEWLGLLEKSCTGSVINKRWVLTASHCLQSLIGKIFFGKDVEVLYNSTKLNDAVTVTATAYKYKGSIFDFSLHDIALLKLHKPVNVTPVELPKRTEYLNIGDDVIALGWGTFYHYGQGAGEGDKVDRKPKNLRKVILKVQDSGECKLQHGKHDLICAGSRQETVCAGDSGGPLIKGNVLYGITSGTTFTEFECGGPALFTPVTPYLDWIEKTMFNHD